MTADRVPDTETRASSAHAPDLRLWLRMLACTNLIEGTVRSRLRTEFNITLPRFDLMAQLERIPQGLRMGELSKRMMVTGGNVTGITDQLVAEGLVVREDNPLCILCTTIWPADASRAGPLWKFGRRLLASGAEAVILRSRI